MNSAHDFAEQLYGEGLAERTVKEYSRWIRRLARWCELQGIDLATCPPAKIRLWIDHTVPPGRESRKQAYTALKRYYEGREDAPWEAVRVPRKPKSDPHPLTVTDAVKVRDGAILVGGRAGVATLGLLYTGCRPSEVCQWRWDGLEDGAVRFFRPKNRAWHTVPLHTVLADELERWKPAGAEGFLFPGDRGRPTVTTATVWQWVVGVATTVGVADCNPRRLRATWASHALEATGDVDAVAAVLGHSSTDTTRRYYTSTSLRRRRVAVDAAPY